MKHVVSGAPDRQTILVTGFDAFPGAPHNPTITIVEMLEAMKPRFELLGVDLATRVLPVVYAEVAGTLRRAVEELRPDAILHLGLASRRISINVETRAHNRVSRSRCDASGALPLHSILDEAGPRTLSVTCDADEIVAAIRRRSPRVRRSASAGDYVCNALLYRSLKTAAAPRIGFVHIPLPIELGGRDGSAPTIYRLTDAIVAAILVIVRRPAATCPPAATIRPSAILDR